MDYSERSFSRSGQDKIILIIKTKKLCGLTPRSFLFLKNFGVVYNFCMFKNLFSLALIALVFFSNFGSTQAQAPTQSNLPLVYVTEVNLEKDSYKPGETLKGDVVLLSKNKIDANNLSVALYLVEDGDVNNTGFSTEIKKINNISIKLEESKSISFDFVLPNAGPSNLKIKAQVTMSSGLPLGWEHSKFFNFESTSSFLSLLANRVSLDNGVTYPADYGPHIYKDKKPSAISVEALVSNTSSEDITVTPEIVVYKWPKIENAEEAKVRVGQSVLVKKATNNMTISMPLPNFDYDPGVYEGVLYIKDEIGELKVAEIPFRYIVSGDVVTIHSLSTNKGVLTKSEIFDVKAFVTGTPPDLDSDTLVESSGQNVSLELRVFNERNNLVASEIKEISLLSQNDIVFSLTAKKESKSLRGELVVSKDGKEIKRYSSNLSADFSGVQDEVSFLEKYFIYIISVVVIFILYLSYVFVFKKSLTGKAFVFAVLLSLGSLSYTQAFILESDTGYNTRTAVGVVKQDVFINRPIEGNVLEYGESFNVEGSVLYPYCSNSGGVNTTIETWITKGDGSILDLNSDGNPDYKHIGIDTALSATSSVFIGCENSRHCWYKPTKNFTDSTPYAISSVMPFGNYRVYIKSITKYTSGYIARDFPNGISSTGYLNFSVVPSAPKNVKAETGSCGRNIKLSWDPVSGVTGYYIYRATSPGGSYGFVTSVGTTTYTNTVTNSNTRYYYKVLSYHSASGKSSVLNETTPVNAISSFNCLPGVCKAYPTPIATQPSGAGLCDYGVSSPVVNNFTSYNWTCKGESPLATPCSAVKAVAAPGCDPARIYNIDKCCPVALVAGACPPPPSKPNLSGTTFCTPPSATTATARLSVNSAVGRLPIYHNIYSVSATSSFRTFVSTLTQNTSSHTPTFNVLGLATSTNVNYEVTSYNTIGQSSSTMLMYPLKTPPACPVCPDGVTPKPPSGICQPLSLINNACTFVKDDPTDPDTPRVNRWFSQLAHATGTNPPFTLTWSGDVPAADFSISTTASTSKLRTRYDTPGLKNLNMRVRDVAGNEINKSCSITVYCPDGSLNCAGTLIPSISRIDNSCLFPTTKNTIYFNSNSAVFPVNYSIYRKNTGDSDISYQKLGTYIQNSNQDVPVFVDNGLSMVKNYTYRVWASNAYNFNVYSAAVSSTTGFCSGTLCPDGSSALSDGSCPSQSVGVGGLEFNDLYTWPPRVNHGDVCKIYLRKVTGGIKQLFKYVPAGGVGCSISGPVQGSFPSGISPSSFNPEYLFTLYPSGDIYFISKPVTGTSFFEINCGTGVVVSSTCKVAPTQSDTSFFEKVFKVSKSLRDGLVGALLFSLGFGE